MAQGQSGTRQTTDRFGVTVTSSTTVGSDAVLSFLGFDEVIGTIRMDARSPNDLAVSPEGERIFVANYDGVHVVSMSGFA